MINDMFVHELFIEAFLFLDLFSLVSKQSLKVNGWRSYRTVTFFFLDFIKDGGI